MTSQKGLADRVAERIQERADPIVEGWIDWIQERVRTRTINALPRQALRNHIPPVVRSLAEYIRSPLSATRTQMLGNLELHGRIRRDQGYDIQELLAEFDGLAHLLMESFRDLIQGDDGCTVEEVLLVMERFASGVRAIGFVTVGAYRELEAQQKRRLAESLQEFARAAGHEIRNPLNTISLGLQMLESNRMDEAQRAEQFAIMRQALERASHLLEDVRVVAFAEGARHEPSLNPLERVLQLVLDELRPAAETSGVAVQIEGEIPRVDVDSVAAQLALINVVSNSIKYSDPLKAERWLRISAEVSPCDDGSDLLTLRVRDNGLGIPSDLVRHVFQRHFRAHPEAADGTGLGLALCRQVLTERGGDVSLETVEGEGTLVTLRMGALSSAAGPVQRETAEKLMRRSLEALIDREQGSAPGHEA